MKALIIDDEPHVITVARLLVDWNAHGIDTILSCGSSEEALALIREHRPEIILSDINLPGLSGLDLIAQIRQMALPAQVILITAYSDFAYAQRAIQLDCVDYLLKPLQEELLNQAIAKALKKHMEETAVNPSDTLRESTSEETDAEEDLLPSGTGMAEICRNVQRYLFRHYTQAISLDSLSAIFGISPSHLSRCYKKELGIGLVDNLTMIRLEAAKALLAQGHATSQVAEAVGFTDSKYFNRVFKKHFQCTPGEFRRKGELHE